MPLFSLQVAIIAVSNIRSMDLIRPREAPVHMILGSLNDGGHQISCKVEIGAERSWGSCWPL